MIISDNLGKFIISLENSFQKKIKRTIAMESIKKQKIVKIKQLNNLYKLNKIM